MKRSKGEMEDAEIKSKLASGNYIRKQKVNKATVGQLKYTRQFEFALRSTFLVHQLL